MIRQEQLVSLSMKSLELLNEIIGNEKDSSLRDAISSENGDRMIFNLKNGQTIEYSLSEIGYIFEDDLENFEIFSKKKYGNIYKEIKSIQIKTEQL